MVECYLAKVNVAGSNPVPRLLDFLRVCGFLKVMKYKKNKLESARVSFDVTIEAEEVKNKLHIIYKKFSNQHVMDGFRPGKVPIELIKKKFDKNIKAEFFHTIFTEVFDEILKKESIQCIGDPKFYDLSKILENISELKDFLFQFEIEKNPEISHLGNYKNLEIQVSKKDRISIQKYVDDKIKQLQKKQSKIETKLENKVSENDIVQLQYYCYEDEDMKDKSNNKSQLFSLDLNEDNGHFLYRFKKDLIGLKRSDEKIGILKKDMLEEEIKNSSSQGKNIYVYMKVVDIFILKLPSVDDELAKDYHFLTIQDLIHSIENELSMKMEDEDMKVEFEHILKKIIQESSFLIGENFIQIQMDYHIGEMRKKISFLNISFEEYVKSINGSLEEYVDQLREDLIYNTKYNLVYNRLIKEFGIENFNIRKEEIIEEIRKYLKIFQYHNKKEEDFLREKEKYTEIEKKFKVKKLLNILKQNNKIR